MNRHAVISMVLAVALFLSAYAFCGAVERYMQGRRQWTTAVKQADALKQRHQQLMRHQSAIEHLKTFVEQAQARGLVKERWAYYPITIDEAVTFSVAEEVLNQAAPTDAYYFKPSMLHMKRNVGHDNAQNGEPQGSRKDLLLTLKGSFLVRQHDR